VAPTTFRVSIVTTSRLSTLTTHITWVAALSGGIDADFILWGLWKPVGITDHRYVDANGSLRWDKYSVTTNQVTEKSSDR